MKKNRLIAILMAVTITLTYMPAMAYGGSEQPASDADEAIGLDAENEASDLPEADENEDSEEPAYEPDEATEDTAAPDADAEETQSLPDQNEETAETVEEPDGEKTLSAFASTEWKKTGSGTVYYAEFPSGYYTPSPLYQKYNRSRVTAYENASNKRVVSTSRVSWIYWHWTFNNKELPNNNYNVLINEAHKYEDGRDYRFFTDFESADNYEVWSGDSRVFKHWRNRPEDGSWWWFRIPVYKQTYADYKKVAVDPDVPTCNKPSVRITSGTITWNEVYGASGYQIQYSTSPQFKNSKKVIVKGGSNCRYKLTGLKPGTVYYIRIRVYVVVNGKAVYKKWGSTCKMTTYSRRGNIGAVKWSGVSTSKCTGKPVKKTIRLVCNGVTLVEGRDYTVTYKNNTRVGIATIIVKGCGKYFGTITKRFRIVPNGTTLSKSTSKTRTAVVRWSCRSRNCSGYQVRYCTRSDFKNCKFKTVKGKNTGSCTLSGLRPNTKYYIEVRVYYIVNNKNYYSAWSKAGAVRTKKASSSGKVYMTSYTKVIKDGNTFYCAGARGLYKITLADGKIQSKTLIGSVMNPRFGAYTYIGNMKRFGNYIYYTIGCEGTLWTMMRANINTGKTQEIGEFNEQIYWGYVIKNNKIYFDDSNYSEHGPVKNLISMNLDGSGRKKTSVIPIMKNADSNAGGYSMIFKESNEYALDYLKTPSGTFYLGKTGIGRYMN